MILFPYILPFNNAFTKFFESCGIIFALKRNLLFALPYNSFLLIFSIYNFINSSNVLLLSIDISTLYWLVVTKIN